MGKLFVRLVVIVLAVILSGILVFAESSALPSGNSVTAAVSGITGTAGPSAGYILPAEANKAQYELEDVVITGTKTKLKIKDSPAAVSVVNQEDIAKKNVVYIDDAVNNLPGVQVARTEKGDQSTVVTIRGVPNYDKNLILLDGISIQNPYNGRAFWNRVPTELVDRIEVVRGPFSSLYGKYALGGVINIITKEPQGRSLNFKINYDSTNIRTTAVNFSDKPINQFAYYLGYENQQIDGYTYDQYIQKTSVTGTAATVATGYKTTTDSKGNLLYNIGEAPKTQISNNNLTGKLYYFPVKGQSLSLLANYSIFDQPTQYGLYGTTWLRNALTGAPISNGTVALSGTGRVITLTEKDFLRGPGENIFYTGNLQYKGDFNENFSLTANLEYTDRPYYNSVSTLNTGATATTGSGIGSSFANNWRKLANIQATISAEKHRLIIGTEYVNSYSRGTADSFPDWKNIDTYNVLYDSDRSEEIIGAGFLQDEWKLLDSLTAIIGARYDNWTTKNGETYVKSLSQEVFYGSRNKSIVSPKISLVYKPIEDASIRASAGTAFNPPTHQELYYYSSNSTSESFPNPDLKPETDNAWEIGGEYTLPSKTTVSGTYFANYLTDLIYADSSIVGGFTTSINVNAGRAEIKGVEVEIKQPIGTLLTTTGNYTYIDPRIVKNDTAPASVGKLIPNISQQTANLGLSVKLDSFSVDLSGTYASKRYRISDNSDVVNGVQGSYDSYVTENVKVTYSFGANKIFAGVDNISDQQYYTIYKTPGRTYNVGTSFSYN